MIVTWTIPTELPPGISSILLRLLTASMNDSFTGIKLDQAWIPYLEGILDASMGNKEVTDSVSGLIEAISVNGSVMIMAHS